MKCRHTENCKERKNRFAGCETLECFESRISSYSSTDLLEIIDKLVARRLTQREWAENAANQGQPDWAARYGSVADAFTEAIDMLEALIANDMHDISEERG